MYTRIIIFYEINTAHGRTTQIDSHSLESHCHYLAVGATGYGGKLFSDVLILGIRDNTI